MNKWLLSVLCFVLSSLLFTGIVVYLFRSGIVNKTRDGQNKLRKNMSLKDKLPIVIFLVALVCMLLIYDFLVLKNVSSFIEILAWNSAMVMAWVLYDSFVIDILVIGIWRPKLLMLPDSYTLEVMIEHVKLTFIVGWVFIVPIIMIPTMIYAIII